MYISTTHSGGESIQRGDGGVYSGGVCTGGRTGHLLQPAMSPICRGSFTIHFTHFIDNAISRNRNANLHPGSPHCADKVTHTTQNYVSTV